MPNSTSPWLRDTKAPTAAEADLHERYRNAAADILGLLLDARPPFSIGDSLEIQMIALVTIVGLEVKDSSQAGMREALLALAFRVNYTLTKFAENWEGGVSSDDLKPNDTQTGAPNAS